MNINTFRNHRRRFHEFILAAFFFSFLFLAPVFSLAQAPGVEIMRDDAEEKNELIKKANLLREQEKLLPLAEVREQLVLKTCRIDLPELRKEPLTDREIWRVSKAAHLRVGWLYLCPKCDHWHLNLAGGYFINDQGAVATCFHVVDKKESDYREGYLVAADHEGNVYSVAEVLAGNEQADVAIIRVIAEGHEIVPLPLNANTYPGDSVWCYSDPLGRSGYFSRGMINRFYTVNEKGSETARIEVSTDWAPGSSGAAVLDECGNAVGHVSQITAAGTHRTRAPVEQKSKGNGSQAVRTVSGANSVIVFHCAARAADVLALVEQDASPCIMTSSED